MFETVAMLAALLQSSPQPMPTPQKLAMMAIGAPRAHLRVQVARTKAQRERGLMGVRYLPAHTGMLFIFDTDAPIEFWMKDTLVSLDMVFIAQNSTVRSVFADVPVVPADTADDRIPRRDGLAKFVLELPANEAARDGLAPGIRIRGLPH